MPIIRFADSFSKSLRKFTKNNKKRTQAVKKALVLFQKNPRHPSLRTEKLKNSKDWTVRVDRGNRMFFRWSGKGDTAIFYFIGPHDAYKVKKN